MADLFTRTSTEVSVLVPQQWSQKYYDVLLAELPFASLISKDWEGEIQNLGDVVKISTIPEFADAVELAEDAKSDADAVTATSQSLTINKRIVKDFIVTNKASLQALPFVEKMREMAIYAINKKIQALIVSLIVPSVTPDHTIAYASPTTLALADILAAKELLDTQNVPQGDRHLVCGSAQWNDIFNITGFTSSDFVASGSPLQSGELPAQLLGFMPHMTTAAGANVSYFFHASFMTMAAQQGMAVNEYDMGVDGYRAKRVNCDTLLGIKQLDGKRVVTIS